MEEDVGAANVKSFIKDEVSPSARLPGPFDVCWIVTVLIASVVISNFNVVELEEVSTVSVSGRLDFALGGLVFVAELIASVESEQVVVTVTSGLGRGSLDRTGG